MKAGEATKFRPSVMFYKSELGMHKIH